MKLCGCGCGGATTLVKGTQLREGVRAGDYRRFMPGHNRRLVGSKGYPYVGTGALRQHAHRARAERALGRPLPHGAQVHHVDGTKRADASLVICQDQTYHALLHARTKIVRLGGNPNTQRFCCVCRTLKMIGEFGKIQARADGISRTCKACRNERARAYATEASAEQAGA